MKIIILGAGQVGSTLAKSLTDEDHDITVVDSNAEQLEETSMRLDVRTVLGHSSYPKTLAAAGAEDCDALIAVTDSDEANMVACQIAYSLFKIPIKIARIKTDEYTAYNNLFDPDHMPIDVFISPEELVSASIARLIEYPGANRVIDFCNGKITLLAIKCHFNSPLVSKKISEINPTISKVEARVVAIFRSNQAVPLDSESSIEIGDEIFLIAANSDMHKLLNNINPETPKYKNIMIAGGSKTGAALAKRLETKFQVKLIEKKISCCKLLSETLKKTTILHGEGSDTNLLENENVGEVDAFCAVTGDDEANIMACLQAKRLGANPVLALISKQTFVDLIQDGPINIALSPQQISISSILTHIRHGNIIGVHSLRRGSAEAIEVLVQGDEKTSKIIGRQLRDIKLPTASNIGAILRGKKVIIPDSDTVIETEDKMVVFIPKKQDISQIESLIKLKAKLF